MQGVHRYDPPGEYDYPEKRGDAHLLGVSSRGEPVYYDPVAHVKLVGEREPTAVLPDWAARSQLDPEVEVHEILHEVEEAVGWDAITSFAHEHLPGAGDDGAEGDDCAGRDDHDARDARDDSHGPQTDTHDSPYTMSVPGPTEAETVEAAATDHPAEKEGAELVGVSTRGAPWYYDADANMILEGIPDDPDAWSRRESLGTGGLREFLRELEEGWEVLTHRARELVGSERPDDGDGGDEA